MNTPRMTAVALVLALVWATGCATTAKMATAKKEGMSQVYHVSRAGAWKIAKTVLRWQGMDGFEENRRKGVIMSRNGSKWMPWGSMKAAWIERVNKTHTRVTVVTKRQIGIDLGTVSSEAKFHKQFAQALKIVKRGKRLPAQPPK